MSPIQPSSHLFPPICLGFIFAWRSRWLPISFPFLFSLPNGLAQWVAQMGEMWILSPPPLSLSLFPLLHTFYFFCVGSFFSFLGLSLRKAFPIPSSRLHLDPLKRCPPPFLPPSIPSLLT
ncbi:hypothetical protein IE53DRAFT_232383 [Violaceomyces palustris]|uniref:Uncharacterized protein n=1 Tax=Violaceomyces palustris TaxID=1673888 RepID=A0ACD0NPL3_9BASI|nr:hypothetical protein IE53DRAFT_232383 [Violaceomyces palustris]